ncbi:syndecan-3 [Liasis olivaceus]
MPRLLPSRPRSQAGLPPPPLLLLLLLAGHVARAQQWRNENFERPIDMEGSGDDDSFEDEEIEEMEDFYSGSGSGYFKQDPGSKTVVRLTTDSPILLATTSAVLPVTSVQPVATPLAPLPTEEVISDSATNGLYIPRISEAPAATIWKAVGITAATAARDVATTAASTMATTASTTTTVTSKPTTVLRDLPPVITIVAMTQSMMIETPATATVARTEMTASPLGTTSGTKVRDMAKLSTSQEPDVTTVSQPPTAAPTESAQAEPMEMTLSTATNNELEVPVSGDFEIHEEEEAAQTKLGNEVVPLVTPAAGPGLKKKVEPGLLDNTIESGNSAAQLPQKNILERKEVLIAVIVGGVVGALFAAFLVMLLIYRMKKKDEGSYTLEEPKQASVTYQKPDKQEEFYA